MFAELVLSHNNVRRNKKKITSHPEMWLLLIKSADKTVFY